MKKTKNKAVAVFQAKNGAIELRGDFDKETLWATLDQIAEIFGRDKSVISRHIRNIFLEGELARKQLLQKMQQLPQMEKHTRWSFIISTSCFPLDIE